MHRSKKAAPLALSSPLESNNPPSEPSLDFTQFIHRLDPNPEFIPNPWKKAFDRTAKVALVYQLDLLSSIPRIKKAVRINCVEYGGLSNGGCLLIPTVFINDQPLAATFVRTVMGKRNIAYMDDLTALLEQVGNENEPLVASHPSENLNSAGDVGSSLPDSEVFDEDRLPAASSTMSQFLASDSLPANVDDLDDYNDTAQPDYMDFSEAEEDDTHFAHREKSLNRKPSSSISEEIPLPHCRNILPKPTAQSEHPVKPLESPYIVKQRERKRVMQRKYRNKPAFAGPGALNTSEGYYKQLKEPIGSVPDSCVQMNEKTSPWYFMISRGDKEPLVPEFPDIFIETGGQAKLESLCHTGALYKWNLFCHLLGGERGLKRLSSLWVFGEKSQFAALLDPNLMNAMKMHLTKMDAEHRIPRDHGTQTIATYIGQRFATWRAKWIEVRDEDRLSATEEPSGEPGDLEE